jgi:gliding motility-associated-like protein
MPSAFTPNGDNLNDFFYPLTRGVSLIKRFQIFSRYGQLIYEKYNIRPNERNFGWDGTINGKPQGSGNFIFIVDAECDLGNLISTKGSVMLLR